MRINNISFLPGEVAAIQTVIRLAKAYGYGNLIAHLRRAWAIDLKKKYGGTYNQHLRATNVDALPESFDHLDERAEGEQP